MGPEIDITRVLGAHAAQVVVDITDAGMRTDAVATTHACALAIETVGSLNLARLEKLALNPTDLSLWRAASPEVRVVVRAVNSAVAEVQTRYPRGETSSVDDDTFDLDAAFEEPLVEAPVTQTRDRLTVTIDDVLAKNEEPSHDSLGDSLGVLIRMMRDDHRRVAGRLTNRLVISERWNLLAELQELRDRSLKFLEAMAVTILQAFSAQPPEELLPRYRSDAARAAAIRSAIATLRLKINELANLFEHAEAPTLRGLGRNLLQEVGRFSDTVEYGYLRAFDKREVVGFREAIAAWDESDRSRSVLRDAVEGFSKFLDVMRGINRRPELTHRDKQFLAAAHDAYVAGEELPEVAKLLGPLHGRDDELDAWVRAVRDRETDIAIPLGLFARLTAELSRQG